MLLLTVLMVEIIIIIIILECIMLREQYACQILLVILVISLELKLLVRFVFCSERPSAELESSSIQY